MCPIDERLFSSVSVSFRCRGGGSAVGAVPMLHLAASSPLAQNDQMVFQMGRFATFMMDGMAKMQDLQNKMLGSFSSPLLSLADGNASTQGRLRTSTL